MSLNSMQYYCIFLSLSPSSILMNVHYIWSLVFSWRVKAFHHTAKILLHCTKTGWKMSQSQHWKLWQWCDAVVSTDNRSIDEARHMGFFCVGTNFLDEWRVKTKHTRSWYHMQSLACNWMNQSNHAYLGSFSSHESGPFLSILNLKSSGWLAWSAVSVVPDAFKTVCMIMRFCTALSIPCALL